MPAALQTVSTITDFVNFGTDPSSLSEHSISTRLREIVKPKALVKSNPDEPSRKWASLSLPKMCERGSRTLRTTTILKIWIQPFFRPSGDTSISHQQRWCRQSLPMAPATSLNSARFQTSEAFSTFAFASTRFAVAPRIVHLFQWTTTCGFILWISQQPSTNTKKRRQMSDATLRI